MAKQSKAKTRQATQGRARKGHNRTRLGPRQSKKTVQANQNICRVDPQSEQAETGQNQYETRSHGKSVSKELTKLRAPYELLGRGQENIGSTDVSVMYLGSPKSLFIYSYHYFYTYLLFYNEQFDYHVA